MEIKSNKIDRLPEKDLAQKRAIVLEYLEGSKKKVKKFAEPEPAPVTRPTSIKSTSQSSITSMPPISKFLTEKNKNFVPVKIDFLDDVKKEQSVARNKKVIKKSNQTNTVKSSGNVTDEFSLPGSAPESLRIAQVELKLFQSRTNNESLLSHPIFSWLGYILSICLLFVSSYALICLFYYTFRPDNAISRKVAQIMPIPAIISTYGFIDFYQFKDLETNIKKRNEPFLSLNTATIAGAVKWQIINLLAKNYTLNNYSSATSMIERLGKAVVSDHQINALAFTTIRKIKQDILLGRSLEESAANHGQVAMLESMPMDEVGLRFTPSVKYLSDGEVSSIVVTPEGFYIVQKLSSTNQVSSLKYVLVKPMTLDQIIESKIKQVKVLSLVR